MSTIDSPSHSPQVLRGALGTGLLCGLAYFVVLEAFLAIPLFNGATQIRPASGLGPTLGLIFGLPGALGCAAGNLVSDLMHWPDDPAIPLYFLSQLVYCYELRGLWRLVFKDEASPRLTSAKHIAIYIMGSLADAALITLLLLPFEADAMQALNIHVVRLLNNFLALVYVGPPIMFAVETMRGRRRGRTLTERFALAALAVTAIASFLCVAVMLAFGSIDEADGAHLSEGFDQLMAQVYLVLAAITICLFGLVCVMLFMLERALATPLHELAEDARTLAARMDAAGPEQMRDGALDVHFSPAHVLEEIALVATESNEMRHALGRSMLDAQEAARERERVSVELDLASSIQANALPTNFSDLEACYAAGIEAVMQPARTVGGDFYDVFPLDERRICVLVADVSDKGVPAALFMMRAMADVRECLRSAASLGEGLSHATTHLSANNDAMLFVTLFAAALDARTGTVEYANAGHNPPLLCSSARGNRWLNVRPGLPLAVLDDYDYQSETMTLLPDEQLVLYTDGVTEARSVSGELFGAARLAETLAQDGSCGSSRSPVQRVTQTVDAFTQGTEQADDLTVLSLSWLPAGASVHFEARSELCPEVCAYVRAHLSQTALDEMGFNLELIVEELYVNVATHAYNGQPEENAGIEIYVADDTFNHVVHLMLQDSGVEYDPTAHKARAYDGTERPDDLRPGGLGILLVQKLSDSVRYERLDGKNILHVTKSYGL